MVHDSQRRLDRSQAAYVTRGEHGGPDDGADALAMDGWVPGSSYNVVPVAGQGVVPRLVEIYNPLATCTVERVVLAAVMGDARMLLTVLEQDVHSRPPAGPD